MRYSALERNQAQGYYILKGQPSILRATLNALRGELVDAALTKQN